MPGGVLSAGHTKMQRHGGYSLLEQKPLKLLWEIEPGPKVIRYHPVWKWEILLSNHVRRKIGMSWNLWLRRESARKNKELIKNILIWNLKKKVEVSVVLVHSFMKLPYIQTPLCNLKFPWCPVGLIGQPDEPLSSEKVWGRSHVPPVTDLQEEHLSSPQTPTEIDIIFIFFSRCK